MDEATKALAQIAKRQLDDARAEIARLTAAQERIETLEGALSRIDVGHGWAAQIARAALDATEKGEE